MRHAVETSCFSAQVPVVFLKEAYKARAEGTIVVKGTYDVILPIDGVPPKHMCAARFDPRPCSDAIRRALLWPARRGALDRGTRMFDMLDQLRDLDQ